MLSRVVRFWLSGSSPFSWVLVRAVHSTRWNPLSDLPLGLRSGTPPAVQPAFFLRCGALLPSHAWHWDACLANSKPPDRLTAGYPATEASTACGTLVHIARLLERPACHVQPFHQPACPGRLSCSHFHKPSSLPKSRPLPHVQAAGSPHTPTVERNLVLGLLKRSELAQVGRLHG